MTDPIIVWFRQDLRLTDQAALAAAAREGPVIAVYVLDDEGPGESAMGGAQRWWLHHGLTALAATLKAHRVPLVLRRGAAAAEVARVAREADATRIHALRHYEPWWKEAEEALGREVDLVLHDGTRLLPPDRVRTGGGDRYRIFTPYWRALSRELPPPEAAPAPDRLTGARVTLASDRLADWALLPATPAWAAGFDIWRPGEQGATDALDRFLDGRIDRYDTGRNLPSEDGTSGLSPHLHFGEISPATVWHRARDAAPRKAEGFLRELGWRDFTANAMELFPDIGVANGRAAFDRLEWRDSPADLRAWQRGRTGYPIVDAGMRQLWTSGWMHNRVRMIAASFLVKHLLIDWRKGERWFWDTLVDADYGNNSVNWQWVAGTGVDSSPFARIMAPLTQSVKFDATGYIRRWVPELRDLPDAAIHDPHGNGRAPPDYPAPLIGHQEARERALAAGLAARSPAG